MSSEPYTVVQWATGQVGMPALRGIIEHPELELMGAFVAASCAVPPRWVWPRRAISMRCCAELPRVRGFMTTSLVSAPAAIATRQA